MKVLAVFMRHTAYEKAYDGVDTAFLGVYDNVTDATKRIKEVAEQKERYLKEVYEDYNMDGDIFFTNETNYEKGYAELLVGDDEKYEYFFVPSDLNVPTYDEI